MNDIYALRRDGPNYYNSAPTGMVRNREYDGPIPADGDGEADAPTYLASSDLAGYFQSSDYFELVLEGATVEDVLGGSVEEATEAIEAGGHDDHLDVLLWAEKQGDARVEIKEAIESRRFAVERSEGNAEQDSEWAPTAPAGGE